MTKIVTAQNLRDGAGTGGVINPVHQGNLKPRPVEAFLKTLENWSPLKKKTPADFFNEKRERELGKPIEAPPSSSATAEHGE